MDREIIIFLSNELNKYFIDFFGEKSVIVRVYVLVYVQFELSIFFFLQIFRIIERFDPFCKQALHKNKPLIIKKIFQFSPKKKSEHFQTSMKKKSGARFWTSPIFLPYECKYYLELFERWFSGQTKQCKCQWFDIKLLNIPPSQRLALQIFFPIEINILSAVKWIHTYKYRKPLENISILYWWNSFWTIICDNSRQIQNLLKWNGKSSVTIITSF